MKSKSARVLLALGVAAAIVACILVLATVRLTPFKGWTLTVRPTTHWLRSFHHYRVLTHANGTRSVRETKSLLALVVSRPLYGTQADQALAIYDQLTRRMALYHQRHGLLQPGQPAGSGASRP